MARPYPLGPPYENRTTSGENNDYDCSVIHGLIACAARGITHQNRGSVLASARAADSFLTSFRAFQAGSLHDGDHRPFVTAVRLGSVIYPPAYLLAGGGVSGKRQC